MRSASAASSESFLTRAELLEVGFGAHRIALGSHVRIDAGVVLSAGDGGILVGDHVHIAVRVFMTGAAKIELRNFAGVSAGTAIFSSNDDYSGAWLTGPGHPGQPAQRHQRPRRARRARDRRSEQRHPPRRHNRTGRRRRRAHPRAQGHTTVCSRGRPTRRSHRRAGPEAAGARAGATAAIVSRA